MEALFSSSANRLLGIAILIFLQFPHDAVVEGNSSNNEASPRNHLTRTLATGGIEASVVAPVFGSDGGGHTKAEVRVLVPAPPKEPPDPFGKGLIRANSIMMEYEEDTRKYISPKESEKTDTLRHIRHQRHRAHHFKPPSDDNSPANDAPADDVDSGDNFHAEDLIATGSDPKMTVRIPAKLIVYGVDRESLSKGRQRKPLRIRYKPGENETWIAVHSPVQIFIQVRINDADSSSDKACVQCPGNVTLIAQRGETHVDVPAPSISICPSLAREPGRINIAVSTGPRPGLKVTEGHYPTEIIIWKHHRRIHSCQFSLDVKVKRCKDVPPPYDGSVECSNGNAWGSRCKFSCSRNSVLKGHHTITCDDDGHSSKMSWSASFPKCKKNEKHYVPAAKRRPCHRPEDPNDGTVVCRTNTENIYPDGSICQFFCFPGFLIESLLTNSSLIICKNGLWTPHSQVSCFATHCTEPKPPKYGSVVCDHNGNKDVTYKSKYKNGTSCHFQCNAGFTIPKSQQKKNKIICTAPVWNQPSIPECKQSITPVPDQRDCRNVTLLANRRGFAKLKTPRFHESNPVSSKNFLYGNCTLKGRIGIGSYINYCTAYNDELNTIGSCSYTITVKEKSCPPPPAVPHSTLRCDPEHSSSFPVRAVCEYICDTGFVMPLRERKFLSKKCMPRLKWRPTMVPSCRSAIPPKPKRNNCISQTLFLKNGETSANIKLPRFKSSWKDSRVKVKCTTSGSVAIGNYTNECEAVDVKLGLTSSCKYSISVQANGCAELGGASFSSLNCSGSKNGDYYAPDTICIYNCEEGYVVPSSLSSRSVKLCTEDNQWNDSLIPTCVAQTPPIPAPDSCLDHFTSETDLESFQISIPEFRSSYGSLLQVNCTPQSIASFGEQQVNCTAFDPELRVSGSCSFTIDVRNPNDIAELSREETSCSAPHVIENGVMKCDTKDEDFWPVGTVCEATCHEHFILQKDHQNLSVILCQSNGEWNASEISKCVKFGPPVLISGCIDYTVNVSDVAVINVSLPTFVTSQNAPAITNCAPDTIDDFGRHKITCEAQDENHNLSSTCAFFIDIDNAVESTEANTVFSTETSKSDISYKACQSLEPPRKGSLNCSEDIPIAHCAVLCEEGYQFPYDHNLYHDGRIECDGVDGLWDFQRMYTTDRLPDCLGYLPNTTMKVSLNFSSFVENCEADYEARIQHEIQDQLIRLNSDNCNIADCESPLQTTCYFNPPQNRYSMTVTWMIQIGYNPLEYEHTKNVSTEENILEDILKTTHSAVTSASSPFRDTLLKSGVDVDPNSPHRGFFMLACQKSGYAVHQNTNICVECPSETFEMNSACFSCPDGAHQPLPGQSSCNCPENMLWTGDQVKQCSE